jgi:hypothetical protein
MTSSLRTWPILLILSVVTTTVYGADDLTLSNVVKPGTTKHYDHNQSVVLAPGFWAQAGADATATINQVPGYFLDKTPLDPNEAQFTSNESRKLIVAGCLPQHRPVTKTSPISGYNWTICNDIDFVKDKVVESEFISCLNLHRNGVLQEFFIKEINNRTWQSFRFSCGDLKPDGNVEGPLQKSPFLFNLSREGTLYQTSVPQTKLTLGMFELEHKLQVRESLLTVALLYESAQAIFDSGTKNLHANNIKLSPKIPPSSPQLLEYHNWYCPPGMVMTGAAIGHIPDNKGKDTRPVYILAECRRLLHNP